MIRCSLLAVMLALAASAAAFADDGITAVKIQGGPPPEGAKEPGQQVLCDVTGTNFALLLPEIQKVTPLLGNEPVWLDVPPSASYVSLVIRLNDQSWTLNSIYPLYRNKNTIAVTDIGLVAVSSRREKEAREKQNSERYRALSRFMDLVLFPPPPAPPPAAAPPAPAAPATP